MIPLIRFSQMFIFLFLVGLSFASRSIQDILSGLPNLQQTSIKSNLNSLCWVFNQNSQHDLFLFGNQNAFQHQPWYLDFSPNVMLSQKFQNEYIQYNVQLSTTGDLATTSVLNENQLHEGALGREFVAYGDDTILVAAGGSGSNIFGNNKNTEMGDHFSREVEVLKISLPTKPNQNLNSTHTVAYLPFLRADAAVGILPLRASSRLVIVAGGWETDDESEQNRWLSDRVHVFGETESYERGWGFELLGTRQLSHARAHISTVCNRRACLFAGGHQEIVDQAPPSAQNFFSNVDVFELNQRGWGRSFLSEPRANMATMLMTIYTEQGDTLELGLLAGGLSSKGPSRTVDVYDFEGHKFLQPLELPTTSGPHLHAVRMSFSAVAFISKSASGQGLIDILDGNSGCWFSMMVPGQQLFSSESADIQLTSFVENSPLLAVFGNHLLEGIESGSSCAEIGGVQLSITQGQCINWDEGLPSTSFENQDNINFPVFGSTSFRLMDNLEDTVSSNDPFTPDKLVLYFFFATTALAVSYLISSLIIIRSTEGVWRVPFPPRSPACRRLAKCCCCEPSSESSSVMVMRRLSCLRQRPLRSREILKGGQEIEVTELRTGLTHPWLTSQHTSSGESTADAVNFNTFQVQGNEQLAAGQVHPHQSQSPSELPEESASETTYQGSYPVAPYP